MDGEPEPQVQVAGLRGELLEDLREVEPGGEPEGAPALGRDLERQRGDLAGLVADGVEGDDPVGHHALRPLAHHVERGIETQRTGVAEGCRARLGAPQPAGRTRQASRDALGHRPRPAEGVDVEPGTCLLDPARPLRDRALEGDPPVLEEGAPGVLARLLQRLAGHLGHHLGGVDHPDAAVGHGVDVLGLDDEAVDTVADLLARTVVDVVADHRAAEGERLQGREGVALVDAGHDEAGGVQQRFLGARVMTHELDVLADVEGLDQVRERLVELAVAVDLELGLGPLLDHLREGLDGVLEALLRLEPGDGDERRRLPLGHRLGQLRQLDRVGHDEPVRGRAVAHRDVLGLAMGEVHEGVVLVDVVEQRRVLARELGVPAALLHHMVVVHEVEEVEAVVLARHDVAQREPGVGHEEDPLGVTGEQLEPVPQPAADGLPGPDRKPVGVGEDVGNPGRGRGTRPGRAQVDRPVGATVVARQVLPRLGVSGVVDRAVRVEYVRRGRAGHLGQPPTERGDGRVGLVGGGVLAIPLVEVEQLHALDQLARVAQHLAHLVVDGLRLGGQQRRRDPGVLGDQAVAHDHRPGLPTELRRDLVAHREVAALRERDLLAGVGDRHAQRLVGVFGDCRFFGQDIRSGS